MNSVSNTNIALQSDDVTVAQHRKNMEAACPGSRSDNETYANKAAYLFGLRDEATELKIINAIVSDPKIDLPETTGMLINYMHPAGRQMRGSQVDVMNMLVKNTTFGLLETDAAEKFGPEIMGDFFRAIEEMVLRDQPAVNDHILNTVQNIDQYLSGLKQQRNAGYSNIVSHTMLGNGPASTRMRIAEVLFDADPKKHALSCAKLVEKVLDDDSARREFGRAETFLQKMVVVENPEIVTQFANNLSDAPSYKGEAYKVVAKLSESDHNMDRNLSKKIKNDLGLARSFPVPTYR